MNSADIQLDFDEASNAWMANKVRRGAMVYYHCTATQKNGKPCTRIAANEAATKSPEKALLCTQHSRYPGHSSTVTESLNSASNSDSA